MRTSSWRASNGWFRRESGRRASGKSTNSSASSRQGTTIVKFFLHISRGEQLRRLRSRLDDPEKNWKFVPADLDDRALWEEYTEAYRDVLAECSPARAPWFVVPSDDKDVRDFLVAGVVVKALEKMGPAFPKADPDVLSQAKRLK
jgi:hypothetical protein